jgi:hypothetical protein
MPAYGRQREYAEAPRSRPWRAKAFESNGGLLAWLRAGAAGNRRVLATVRFRFSQKQVANPACSGPRTAAAAAAGALEDPRAGSAVARATAV